MKTMTAVRSLRRRIGAAAHRSPTLKVAWFDEHDALEQVDRRTSTDADRRILSSWVRDGYAIVEQAVPHERIDAMQADVDGLFTARRPIDELFFYDLVTSTGHRATMTHRELLELPLDERLAARDRSNWRAHQLFRYFPSVEAMMRHDELVRIASMILGAQTQASFSINFHNGSAQALHEDTAVFHLAVPTLICGVWVACEDILDGCGPLRYFPGSHRRELFAGFENYPLTNLRTASPDVTNAYRAHLDGVLGRYEPHSFLARKGDVLFWHGMLIHGGEPIRRPELTRRSFVTHFVPDGVNVQDRVTGPTNW